MFQICTVLFGRSHDLQSQFACRCQNEHFRPGRFEAELFSFCSGGLPLPDSGFSRFSGKCCMAKRCRAGSMNAAVLPEPVWEETSRSFPSMAGGMAFVWTGSVGRNGCRQVPSGSADAVPVFQMSFFLSMKTIIFLLGKQNGNALHRRRNSLKKNFGTKALRRNRVWKHKRRKGFMTYA